MTWNPLKKTHLISRPPSAYPAVTQEEDRELDTLFLRLRMIEEANRRLQKEMKRYLEAVSCAEKAEVKLTSDLSSSSLCYENSDLRQLIEDYHSVAVQKNENVVELMRLSQRTFQEPLKKFGAEFYGLAAVLQLHEQQIQDWKNIATRLRKLEDRGDKMPNTIVKIERERLNMTTAAEAISATRKKLLEELPVFHGMRVDYIQPCLQAIIQAQLDYHGSTTRAFTLLMPSTTAHKVKKDSLNQSSSAVPEAQFLSSLESKMAAVRGLSIIKQNA